MFDVGDAPIEELEPSQYIYCRETKTMSLRLPCGVEDVFMKYYAAFERLDSGSDCVPIQSSLFPALKLLMRTYYSDDS